MSRMGEPVSPMFWLRDPDGKSLMNRGSPVVDEELARGSDVPGGAGGAERERRSQTPGDIDMSKVTAGIAISVDGSAAGPNQSEENRSARHRRALAPLDVREPEENAEEIAAHHRGRGLRHGPQHVRPGGASGTSTGTAGGETSRRTTRRSSSSPTTRASRCEMAGGTTFHFVTDGIEAALERAREAAGDSDVAIAGGAATVNQYLAAGLIDELRLHVAPVVLGAGERLFDGVDSLELEPLAVSGTSCVTDQTYRVVR